MKRLVFSLCIISAFLRLPCACQSPEGSIHDPVFKAFVADSLPVWEARCEDLLAHAYMAQDFIEERRDIPDWERFPVKLYEYRTPADSQSGLPKTGKVYMLNPSARQLAMWIFTAVWEVKRRMDYAAIKKIYDFILWQSAAQFPVKGVVYEDMYIPGHYEPYVFKDGVTVYVADSTMFPADKTCTPEQLDYYLNLTDEQLKPRTGRYARICSTTREQYYRDGGKLPVGNSDTDRNRVWLRAVRELYQQAWKSDRNGLILAWAKANL